MMRIQTVHIESLIAFYNVCVIRSIVVNGAYMSECLSRTSLDVNIEQQIASI